MVCTIADVRESLVELSPLGWNQTRRVTHLPTNSSPAPMPCQGPSFVVFFRIRIDSLGISSPSPVETD
jgi:hypothetical protein